MKILVASSLSQGQRKNDFIWADEGEFVTFPSECSREKVDGKCGCKRSMAGIDTRKATTTMKIIETSLTVPELVAKFAASDLKAGWYSTMEEAIEENQMMVNELLKLADKFEVNDILERRGNVIRVRNLS